MGDGWDRWRFPAANFYNNCLVYGTRITCGGADSAMVE